LQARLTQVDPRVVAQLARCERLKQQIQEAEAQIQKLLTQPTAPHQNGPYSQLSRLRQQAIG
jgi:hypothetical protein